jgi:hypothetical protein
MAVVDLDGMIMVMDGHLSMCRIAFAEWLSRGLTAHRVLIGKAN